MDYGPLVAQLNRLHAEQALLREELLREQVGKGWQWVHVRRKRLHQLVSEIERLTRRIR